MQKLFFTLIDNNFCTCFLTKLICITYMVKMSVSQQNILNLSLGKIIYSFTELL